MFGQNLPRTLYEIIDIRSNKGTRLMFVEVSRQSALQSRAFFERCDTDTIKQVLSLLEL